MQSRIVRALIMLIGLAGCAATVADPNLEQRMGNDPETLLCDCCKDTETMSADFVRFMEDNAEEVVPILRTFKFRTGFLVGRTEAQALLIDALQPLDVLFVVMGHTLSGRMTSGYLQHASVYLGDEDDLRALGIWDHPLIVPLQDAIRAGAVVIEANGDAVRLIGPDVLFDSDGVAAFAPSGLTRAETRAGVLSLVSGLGMPFDFHFDLDTDDAVFCVELLRLGLPNLPLPEREIYGRTTAAPDQLAADALQGRNSLTFRGFIYGRRDMWGVGSATLLAQTIARGWGAEPPQEE